MYPPPSPVLIFRREVSMYHESKLLWWNAQKTSASNPRTDDLGEPMYWLSESAPPWDLARTAVPSWSGSSDLAVSAKPTSCLAVWISNGVAQSSGFALRLGLAGLTPVA